MKIIKELVAPAAVGELVSRLVSFLISRYAKQTCRKEEMFLQLELVALKIHALVDEAERRHLAHNRRLLLWLSKLMEGMYRAYYVLDRRHDGSLLVSSSWSFSLLPLSTRPAKRRRCTSSAPQPVCAADDANAVVEELSATLRRLEECAQGMKEFILLLACCPTLPRRPAVFSFQSDDRYMFGRLVEREQIISFLLQPDSRSLGVLPLVGGPEVGKGTIVKHVCSDERVRRHFATILYSYGSLLLGVNSAEDDVLGTLRTGGHVLHESTSPVVVSGRHLLVVKNTYEVVINEAAWASLCACLRSTAPGSKVIVVSENDGVADLGTTAAMRVRPLPREEFWYFFRSLSFGGVSDPAGEHPELAVLGRQIAAALDGSFFGAKVLSSLLRANLNAQFWGAVLGVVRRFITELRGGDDHHFSKLGVAKIALEILPVPLRLKSAGQTTGGVAGGSGADELPGITVHELLRSAGAAPTEEVRIVLWESACPPNYRYTVVCEKIDNTMVHAHANVERKRHADAR